MIFRFTVGLLVWVALLVAAAPAIADPSYAGSAACGLCHKDVYEKWKDTLHNKSQQEISPTNDPVVVNWSGTVKLKAGKIPEVSIELVETPDGVHRATLIDAKEPAKRKTYAAVRTYGGWGWKQRYHVKIGDSHYILPIQWNQATSRWVPYNLQNWYNEDGSLREPALNKSFEAQCSGCHNTGLEIQKTTGGEFRTTYVELNIGCERCHGPGSEHVKSGGAKTAIVNPRKLSFERGIEVCGQCHSRGLSQPNGVHEFAWDDANNQGYVLGQPLSRYYSDKGGRWAEPEGHSRQHHQQWLDYQKSKHFGAKITCFDCHDPHGGPGENQLVKADYNNTLCLSCHVKDKRFASNEAIRKHTRHNYAPETRGTSRCSSCHLVATASSAEARDIHAHDFRVIRPDVSLQMFAKDPANVIGNSCNGCHVEWGKDKAGYEKGVAAYRATFGN
jgi:predicted CXXCH cytochrome family protein